MADEVLHADLKVSGGTKMEAALAEIAAKVRRAAVLRVGFFEDAKYPDGTSVAMVGAIQNDGAPKAGIPPRPFFSTMVAIESKNWPKAIRDLLIENDYDARKTLEIAGEGIKGQLQRYILDWSQPPNAESTIEKKGFNDPLFETGHMVNSVGAKVE